MQVQGEVITCGIATGTVCSGSAVIGHALEALDLNETIQVYVNIGAGHS